MFANRAQHVLQIYRSTRYCILKHRPRLPPKKRSLHRNPGSATDHNLWFQNLIYFKNLSIKVTLRLGLWEAYAAV